MTLPPPRRSPSFPFPSGEQKVGYGFYAPDGDRRGRWQASPAQAFRATKIYAWCWHGERALVSSLRFGNLEQLVPDHPVPADLFSTWASPVQFLEMYGGVRVPTPGFHRVVMKSLPGQLLLMAALDFPTVSIGGWFSVEWTGPLAAFFLCGRELLPEKRDRGHAADRQQPTAPKDEKANSRQQTAPDPDPALSCELSAVSCQLRAGTKDTTPS